MSEADGFDAGRFGRILGLVAFVTAVFLLLSANRFGPQLFQIAAVAIGTVALITAMVGYFLAAASAFEE